MLAMIAFVSAGDGCGAAASSALVPLAQERRDAGHRRRRCDVPEDQSVERVARRERAVADAAAVEVPPCCGRGAGDVRARRDDVGLHAPVVRRPAAREVDDVVRVVGTRVGDAAAVREAIARTFSAAPTVITFLAVPGAPIVFAPAPELPAEKTRPSAGCRRRRGRRRARARRKSARRRCRRRRRPLPTSCSRCARPSCRRSSCSAVNERRDV